MAVLAFRDSLTLETLDNNSSSSSSEGSYSARLLLKTPHSLTHCKDCKTRHSCSSSSRGCWMLLQLTPCSNRIMTYSRDSMTYGRALATVEQGTRDQQHYIISSSMMIHPTGTQHPQL